MKASRIVVVSVLAAAAAIAALAQMKQAQDEEYAKSVKEWTTSPQFMSPLVDHLPKAAGVPTPKDVLGYYIGAPKHLTHTADIARYYRALAAASKRVKVMTIGKTDEGRDCLVTVISDEDTIRDLDKYKGYLARLADPRGLTDEAAHQIIAQAKPIYMFTGGLHSAETGPPEMMMELAYRIAVDESPLYENIRKNVIVMVNGASEPDGRDRYVDWYNAHMLSQESENDRVPGPPYWAGKYIFHDNNRDINYSQMTMRNWLKFYLEWHPPIMHDLHESEPLMYTFSGQPPQNPTLDPILYAELPWFSEFELTKMIGYGMPGVWTHAFVDMWSPGYLGFMSSNHNGMLRMYEIMGNGGANTMRRNIAGGGRGGEGGGGGEGAGGAGAAEGAPAGGAAGAPAGGAAAGGRGAAAAAGGRGGRGGGMTAREWYRPLPPPATITWSIRNNTNYSETGVLSALELTAGFSKTVLENFYLKSRNSVRSGETEAPYAYVLPVQKDMTRVKFIVDVLRLQGIEVGTATAEVKVKDGTFPAGSLIVKRNQPYGRLAKILLEKQDYPEAAATTYDDTGWTMGLMSHATVKEIGDKAILDIPVQPVGDAMKVVGETKGSGPVTAILHNGSNNLITLRYRLKDLKFEAIEQATKAGNTDLPAGTFLVQSSPRVKAEVEALGLEAVALAEAPNVPKHLIDLPRTAVFTTWGSTQDVGWVRYGLDHFEVPYDLIYKERIKQGNLRASYDVIVIPSQGRGGAKGLIFDIEPRPGKPPVDYVKSADFPSLGAYGESKDISGGMGLQGVAEFDKFVNEGGVLLTLGASSFFPAEIGITRTVNAARTTTAFYAPGPIVEAEILKPTHPIMYGYTDKIVPVRWASGPLLTVPADGRNWILARFPGTNDSVLSGLMRGVAETRGRPAIVDVPVGQGHVVLFATNPCYRWQNLGEFNMLANAILNFNDYPKPAPATPGAAAAAGN